MATSFVSQLSFRTQELVRGKAKSLQEKGRRLLAKGIKRGYGQDKKPGSAPALRVLPGWF